MAVTQRHRGRAHSVPLVLVHVVRLDRARLANTNLSQANLEGATGFDPDDHEGITLKKTILPDGTTSD